MLSKTAPKMLIYVSYVQNHKILEATEENNF